MTRIGIPPATSLWMKLYCPQRLALDRRCGPLSQMNTEQASRGLSPAETPGKAGRLLVSAKHRVESVGRRRHRSKHLHRLSPLGPPPLWFRSRECFDTERLLMRKGHALYEGRQRPGGGLKAALLDFLLLELRFSKGRVAIPFLLRFNLALQVLLGVAQDPKVPRGRHVAVEVGLEAQLLGVLGFFAQLGQSPSSIDALRRGGGKLDPRLEWALHLLALPNLIVSSLSLLLPPQHFRLTTRHERRVRDAVLLQDPLASRSQMRSVGLPVRLLLGHLLQLLGLLALIVLARQELLEAGLVHLHLHVVLDGLPAFVAPRLQGLLIRAAELRRRSTGRSRGRSRAGSQALHHVVLEVLPSAFHMRRHPVGHRLKGALRKGLLDHRDLLVGLWRQLGQALKHRLPGGLLEAASTSHRRREGGLEGAGSSEVLILALLLLGISLLLPLLQDKALLEQPLHHLLDRVLFGDAVASSVRLLLLTPCPSRDHLAPLIDGRREGALLELHFFRALLRAVDPLVRGRPPRRHALVEGSVATLIPRLPVRRR
eukprot:scaffold8108_cov267-Pinguiococcus_pyrenoidosus.AAC.2